MPSPEPKRAARVLPMSRLFTTAGRGELHCPIKHGVIAYEKCLSFQQDARDRGAPCTCPSYLAFPDDGRPSRADVGLLDVIESSERAAARRAKRALRNPKLPKFRSDP